MKNFILKTSLAHIALAMRDNSSLLGRALTRKETVGTLANDIISTTLITRICLPGKTFIDIGSHIGSIISEVQRTSATINVVGVEAIPEKVKSLRDRFPSVEIFECALGDANKTVNFFVHTQKSGYSSLLLPAETSSGKIREISVSLKKLDDLRDFQNVDAIKIDVEGSEFGVIKGAANTITNNRPIIMFESSSGENGINEQLWDIFCSLEYGIHLPNRLAHNDTLMSKDCFLDSHLHPRLTTNYFAVPKDKRIDYRDRARRILNIKGIA